MSLLDINAEVNLNLSPRNVLVSKDSNLQGAILAGNLVGCWLANICKTTIGLWTKSIELKYKDALKA